MGDVDIEGATDTGGVTADASVSDTGSTTVPPSCVGLPETCGPNVDELCCTSLLVTGGTYFRSYDGISSGYTSMEYPASVTGFRLDKYEVTVGRFRRFQAAWDAGWRPLAGAGKHTHLNGGRGLYDSGVADYEAGWDPAWLPNVAPTDKNLSCDVTHQTWTTGPGANENRPMVCATWYEQQAFCIWDGGFLPSEAEWNYAAAGGSEQRVYPWSSPPSSTTIDCTYANFGGSNYPASACIMPGIGGVNDVGLESPRGDGKWGQADLSGNVIERTLDWYVKPYSQGLCTDCTDTTAATGRALRGGSFLYSAADVISSYRLSTSPTNRNYSIGARCARSP